MNVTLCSTFRNSAAYIPRYLDQVASLRVALAQRGDHLSIIAGEGDSTDGTRRLLLDLVYDTEIEGLFVDVTHGGPDYGSIVNAERFANLAKVWNAIWARIPTNADVVIFCESDLIWEADTMLTLTGNLGHLSTVAPMVMLKREGYPDNYFYDTFAYRKNGKHFAHYAPYCEWIGTDLVQLDSAGSCIVMRGELARQLTWPAEDVAVGVCRQIYELGGSVWLNPLTEMIHE